MPAQEHRRVVNQGILTRDEVLRLLADQRRTLLKLVAKIDEAIGTVDRSQDREEERAEITLR